jgi:hypothetical protein
MTRQGLICIPILSLMPDGQQEVAKLDRQLGSTRFDSTCFLAVGELVKNLVKMSDV